MAFCHQRGVAHGSLGAGSFLLSHCDDRRPEQLLLKLDNFGYARCLEGLAGAEPPVEGLGRRPGLRAAMHRRGGVSRVKNC